MKILQIIYTLSSGGAERFVVDICNELVKNTNNEVHLLTINARNEKEKYYLNSLSHKVYYSDVGATKGLSVKSIWGVYKTIKRIKPDVVHMHSGAILGYLPAIFYKRTNYIYTIHTIANKAIASKWLKEFQKWLFKKHIQPVTISKICQESYKSFYGQDNAICIINGRASLIATDEAKNVKKEIEGYKRSKETPVFIHVARYSKEKNQELLFNAFNKLHNDGKDFLLVVIGAGFDNSPYMHLNETSHIKILGAKQNVGDYLACADYFVLSSIFEGLPLSLIEAMSMGCIPISTPAGGVVDVIRDGENGLLSPSLDSEDFYKTIEKVFDRKFSIEKNDIIKEYKENYTMEVCVNKYYNIYKKLLNISESI